MNKRFKDTFSSEWVKYVVVIVLSVVIWVAAFGLYHAPKEHEKIELFFAGKVKDYAFAEIAKRSSKEIKKVEISSSNPAEAIPFGQKYRVVGLNGSDVVLVPQSVAESTDCKGSFLPLDGIGEPFKQGEESYGVFLPENAIDALSRYFAFGEERYVAFVVASSVNAGKITDHAIDFVKWLVEYV